MKNENVGVVVCMSKEKNTKVCKLDCIEAFNGYCKLKGVPTQYSKLNLNTLCNWYKKSKSTN